MRIAGREIVAEFRKRHADSSANLNHWLIIAESATWKTPADVRATFRSADFAGTKAVFNIAGNKYRLIAAISFTIRLVVVEAVLTHKEYDKGKWK